MAPKLLSLLTAVLSLLLALPIRAEEPPPRQPILRIDGGAHTAIIRRLAVSADGTILATGSEDKTIRVWSLPDGKLIQTLRPPVGPGDDGKIFAVALSPDGRLIAAGGWDHSTGDDLFYHVYVFDRVTGAILQRLGPNPNVANDLAFSPDGSRLAAGFGLLGVRMWNTADWSLLGGDTDYDGGVYGVTFNAKNDLAVTSRARDFARDAAAQQGLLYQSVETRLLVDGDASADNIRAALSWLEEKVGPDDVGLLFLAGHGVTDARQRFYFLPVGGDPAPDKLRSTAISESEIREAISALVGKTLFFIDACHAASSLDRNEGDVDVTAVVNRMARADSGVIMFASSQGRELSLESSDWKHGAFTAVLLKGLEGGADYEKDGSITTAELNLWLSSKVKELTQDRQSAVMLKPDTVPDFAIARLAHE